MENSMQRNQGLKLGSLKIDQNMFQLQLDICLNTNLNEVSLVSVQVSTRLKASLDLYT